MAQISKRDMYAKGRPESRIVVYRGHFEKLLAYPKPLRDQLIVELCTLQALRPGEVSSLRVEYIDFERGDLQVLDSKKNMLMVIPLDPIVAEHLAEYMQKEHIQSGIVLRPLKGAYHVGRKPGSTTKGVGLSVTHIERIWNDYCKICGIPVMPPRMGRAYWAVLEHFVMGKPIGYIQFMLRHDSLQSTQHYLYERIISYEDQKAIFYQGKKTAFPNQCERFDKCPMAIERCHCRSFTAKPELQKCTP